MPSYRSLLRNVPLKCPVTMRGRLADPEPPIRVLPSVWGGLCAVSAGGRVAGRLGVELNGPKTEIVVIGFESYL